MRITLSPGPIAYAATTRHVEEDAARVVGRDAALEVGCFPKGHSEDFIQRWWPQLLAAQGGQ